MISKGKLDFCDQNRQDFKKVQSYIFRYADRIGEGGFSKVYKGVNEITGQDVAIKIIKYSTLTSKVSQSLLKNQVNILPTLSHPNVIKTYDILTSQNNCYIATQYCEGGDLEKLLIRNKFYEQSALSKIVYGLFKGLKYLNELGILHRDFKTANIFLTSDGTPKIADFGFAIKNKDSFKDISIGSPLYMSPQSMIQHQYSPKSDIWAFGVILYQLLHGHTPLSHCKTQKQLKEKIVIPPKFRLGLSPQIKHFLEKCLIVDPKSRISIEEMAYTPFMTKIYRQFSECIPSKEMYSTYHTSNSNISRNSTNWIINIKFYEEGVALMQYCRLIHKTCQKNPSLLLSQWLLYLSGNLSRIRPQQGPPEKIERFIETAKDYNLKYQTQHKHSNLLVSIQQIKKQCERLRTSVIHNSFSQTITKISLSYLDLLKTETQMLEKFIQQGNLWQYPKCSQVEKFLENMKEISNKSSPQKRGFGPYRF